MPKQPKTVPLTAYIDGEKVVIGHAELVDDGNDLVVNATMVEAFAKKLLMPEVHYSQIKAPTFSSGPVFSMDPTSCATHSGHPQSD